MTLTEPLPDHIEERFKAQPGYETYLECYRDKYPYYIDLAKRVQPKSILEIGVYLGYSMLSMLHGWPAVFYILLIDDESEGVGLREVADFIASCHSDPDSYISYKVADTLTEDFSYLNLIKDAFDIVHIDGNHTHRGVENDLEKFGFLAEKCIICDDTGNYEVQRPVRDYAEKFGLRIEEWPHMDGGMVLWRD